VLTALYEIFSRAASAGPELERRKEGFLYSISPSVDMTPRKWSIHSSELISAALLLDYRLEFYLGWVSRSRHRRVRCMASFLYRYLG